MAAEGLLVSLLPRPGLRTEIERALPGVRVLLVSEAPRRPWAEVRALLVGNPRRELPGLQPGDLPELEFVQTLYTGLDTFPFDRIRPGARVAGNVGGYAPFVAEQAVALLLAAARRIVEGDLMVRAGKLRPTAPVRHLGGRTALIVGYGAIGAEVAVRLRGLGMATIGVNRSGASRPEVDRMIPVGELSEALPTAGVVVNCLPLTRATRGLFGPALLDRFPPEAIFVNVGRAETVDPTALARYLAAAPEATYASDVWWNEEFEAGTVEMPAALAGRPNLLGSPHRGGIVAEAPRFVLDHALENLRRFFAGEAPRYVADPADYVDPTAGPADVGR